LSYSLPAPTIEVSPPPVGHQTTYPSPSSDPYANPNPTAWQNNVICGPSNRDIGFDPSITQRLTTQFCTDLLGYPVSPGQSVPFLTSDTITNLIKPLAAEPFNASYLPTDLPPLPSQPASTSNPSGFALLISSIRSNTTTTSFPLNGSLANCANYLNNCTQIFNQMIELCQADEHWIGGSATYSTQCGVYGFQNRNCTAEWEMAVVKGVNGGNVGSECVRWVQENHPE
jgi:hypothetical protein